MKKILIGVLLVLVLAVTAALIAPSLIDWNGYRAEIAAEIRKATGRNLSIDGDIDVALLPSPKLTLAKARFSNIEGAADPDMVRLAGLDLRVALWPLLSGKVVVQSVKLRGADIRLEKLADGRGNWKFKETEGASSNGGQGAGFSRAGDSVSLQQVIIESSTLTFRDSAKGVVRRVDHINARIAAATLSGPLVARGEFRHGSVPIAFEFESGRLESSVSTKVALEAKFTEAKAKLNYSGLVALGTSSITVTGKISAQGPNFGALIAALGNICCGNRDVQLKPVSVLAQPFALTAGVTGGSNSLSVNNISAELGGTRVNGVVNFAPGTVTNVDGTFTINHFDLDHWLADSVKASTVGGAGKDGIKVVKDGFTLPRDFSVSLDAKIDRIVFRKELVRDLKARILMEKGVLRIRNLSAHLPGGSEATVSGRLRARMGKPRFDGRVRLDSSDFQAMALWLGGDDGAQPREWPRRAHFHAGLGFEPQRVEFRDLDLRLDSSRVTGGIVVALRQRIGIGARLKVDRLNLDAYLPMKPAPAANAATLDGKPATLPAASGFIPLGAFDANLDITAGRLTYGGERIDGLVMEGSLVGGDLTIRKLAVTSFAGAQVEAKGVVRKLDKAPAPDLNLRLSVKDPSRLFHLLPYSYPAAMGKLGALTVDGRLATEGALTRFGLKIVAGKVKFSAKGTLSELGTAPRADFDVRLSHPNFVNFVRLFDPGFKAEQRARGPFSISAMVGGAGPDFKLDKFTAQMGTSRFAGFAILNLAAARPLLRADLKADEIIVDHFLAGPVLQKKADKGRRKRNRSLASAGSPWSDSPIDFELLKLVDADLRIQARAITWRRWRVTRPRLDLTLDNGRLDLRRLTGEMVGGRFYMTGNVAVPAKVGGALRTRLDLDLDRIDLKQAMFNAADIDIARGKVNFKITLSGQGANSWAIARSLAGSGSLTAVEGAVSGFDLARVNQRISNLNDAVSLLTLMQTAMAGGTTRFSRLNGTFVVKGGVLRSSDVSIIANGGTCAGNLMVDIGRWLMDGDVQFRLAGTAEAPPFGLRMKGSLDAPRRIIKANVLQAWLANRAAGALINQFMGRPKQDSGTTDGSSQPPPPTKDQFIKGIFELLKE